MNHSFETDKIISVFNELKSYKTTIHDSPILIIKTKTIFTMNGETEHITYDVYGGGVFYEYEMALRCLYNMLEIAKMLSDKKEIIGGEI